MEEVTRKMKEKQRSKNMEIETNFNIDQIENCIEKVEIDENTTLNFHEKMHDTMEEHRDKVHNLIRTEKMLSKHMNVALQRLFILK